MLLNVLLAAGVSSAGQKGVSAPARMSVDHVILEVADLDAGISDVARATGVTAVKGGVHPGGGTQNALMSLGRGTYLEILAPVAGAALPPQFAGLARLSEPTPVGWAIHSVDIDSTARRVKSSGFEVSKIEPGSRRTPDGSILKWRTLGVTGPGLDAAPFFIEWDRSSPHPSTTSPGGCTLARIEVHDPDPGRVRALVEALGIPAAIRTAKTPGLRVTLDCPKGEVVFGE
jgi:hypothetical protein